MSNNTGNGPIQTSPLYCSDEMIAIRATGDYITLAPTWQTLAWGVDGVFQSGAQWVLNSESNAFALQGVTAQNVVEITGPGPYYKGGGQLFAVDSALGNSITLRRIGGTLNTGWPPGPPNGATGVSFKIMTYTPQIEEATFVLKDRFMIDEAIAFRASYWIYQGVEDPFRVVRRAIVLQVLVDRYGSEARSDRGDFAMKLEKCQEELRSVLMKIQIKFGTFGNSSEPAHLMGCKLSR